MRAKAGRRALLAAPLAFAARRAAPVCAAEPRGPWFDATQLPSFTGTVERYLLNPRGQCDALLFREGPQLVFPPEIADPLRAGVPVGHSLVAWGIRARSAPVITVLAYAPNAETAPALVERPFTRDSVEPDAAQARSIEAEGPVRAPYYTPQGEATGAILEDFTVVLLPPGSAAPFRELFAPGRHLAAAGVGCADASGRALLARRLGPDPAALQLVPDNGP